MIYAFSFTCNRDLRLSALMASTLAKHCRNFAGIKIYNTDVEKSCEGYQSGCGWGASMLKVNALRNHAEQIKDDDYLLSVDSDVVFTSPDVFDYINWNKYGIIGVQHQQPYPTKFGLWGHMSGALIFLRGDIAKKIGMFTKSQLDLIRQEDFKAYGITENEDVIISYLAKLVGAEVLDLPGFLSSGNFEEELTENRLRSFYHLNYCPTQFLGELVTGKWDVPEVLSKKGIHI